MSETQTTTTAVAVAEPKPKPPVLAGERGLQLRSLDDYWRMAQYVAVSGLAPKGLEKPEAALIAMQLGAEVGLPPLASLQQIAVINGRPSIYGDAQLGVVRSTGELKQFDEWFEVNGKRIERNPVEFLDSVAAVCTLQRSGYPPRTESFSVADAKRAGLWGKSGPWSQYPARMLRFRARSFALRDQFGDALRGLKTVDDVLDEGAIDVPVTIVSTPAATGSTAPEVTTKNPEAPASGVSATPHQPASGAGASGASPAAKPEAQHPGDALGEKLVEAGITLDVFNKWAVGAGQIEQEVTAWDEIKKDTAKRLLRVVVNIIGQMKGELL